MVENQIHDVEECKKYERRNRMETNEFTRLKQELIAMERVQR